ncbi:MAG: transposase [Geobacteraceae bacterium]|nr:transposase [Geobacteraceae bacterium]
MARQAFKYKLYSAERNKRLNRQRVAAGQIWNHCIALHKRYYRRFGQHLSQNRLMARVAYLRNHVRTDWKILGSQAVQDVVQRIERGYKLFFKATRDKSGRKVRPPTFKKVSRYRSFTLKQAGWKLIAPGKVKVGGCVYRFHQSRTVEGKVKTVTIGRDSVGDFWITFSVETGEAAPIKAVTGRTAGFDFGLSMFLTGTDGIEVQMPQPLKTDLKRLKKANRELSRKKRGSKSRKRARLALARLHRRIACCRRDFHHKLARELVQSFDVICIEDLNLAGMKSLWGRKVSDLGFAEFVSILEHHCRKAGSRLVKVNRYFPSSKTCSCCGHIHQELSLRDRTWICSHCGVSHDRDNNAAVNIEREGLRLLAHQAGHRLEEEAA